MKTQNTPARISLGAGHDVFVRDWGEGPPVVMLSSWGTDSRLWGEVMTLLNDAGLRTIAYDRRGHGQSSDPRGHDYDTLAQDLARVLDTLALEDVTLVTHSGAAGEAVRYLTRFGSARVSKLVLVSATGPHMLKTENDPEGHVPPEGLELVLGRLGSDLGSWIDENAAAFAPGAPRRVIDWIAAMLLDTSRRALVDFQRTISASDLREEAKQLMLPVTLLHGDRDQSAPLQNTAVRWQKLLPNAELVCYEGAAHGVMLTHAKRLAEDLARRVTRGPNMSFSEAR